MEKYGFVYIWFDRKHKRYYIGCRWGTENDGYICSSTWMKQAYKHRPEDFSRKILSRVYSNRNDLLAEEYVWLSKIKDDELGSKYYNLHNHHFGHWSNDEKTRLSVGQKISASPNRRENISKANKGRIVSEETRQKLSISVSKTMTEEHRKLLSNKTKNVWSDENYRNRMSESHKGKKLTSEHKSKISQSQIGVKKMFKEKTCIHCGKTGRGPNMIRYHFDKCRSISL